MKRDKTKLHLFAQTNSHCFRKVVENKEKGVTLISITPSFLTVGMTGFEPATTRPPDRHRQLSEQHPNARLSSRKLWYYAGLH